MAPYTSADPDRDRRLADVRVGALTMLPVVVAFVPFGLVVGTVLSAHGTFLTGFAGTWAIFGASAHIATVRSFEDAGAWAAILAGLLVHARLAVYSVSLARHWGSQPLWYRTIAAAVLTDPTWAVGERLAAEGLDEATQRRRFLAAGATLGVGFSTTVAIGLVIGARVTLPDLAVAAPLCLLAFVAHALGDRRHRRVVVVAALVASLAASWPSELRLVLAILAGCAAGGPPARRP